MEICRWNFKIYCARLKEFRLGQEDRNLGLGARKTDGKYLDGYYSPNEAIPYFLTSEALEELERVISILPENPTDNDIRKAFKT